MHSLGPWSFEDNKGSYTILDGRKKPIKIALVGSKHNAKIMTAALDLLSACQTFFAAQTNKQHHDAMCQMEEAITKATE